MARKEDRIPAVPADDEVLSFDELLEIYLRAYKRLTGEDWPYPVETVEDMRKLARKLMEIETELENRGEWPTKHHENKRRRKGKKSKKKTSWERKG